MSDQPHLHTFRVGFATACQFIAIWHRHHKPPRGHLASFGAFLDDWTLVGVATVGRPVARAYDDGRTAEVTRVATDGTPNACSALYAVCRRWAVGEGYTRLITYTQEGESGASLRGAGWRPTAQLRARRGWDAKSRPRSNATGGVRRTRWEAV